MYLSFIFQIILNSMQKYQPYLKLTCVNTGVSQSFCFSETMFIAVTAYQNSKVSSLFAYYQYTYVYNVIV